jgi:rod shape-determining protein MreC
MYQLFQYLYKHRAFLLFLLLELISFWFLFRSNPYHSAVYFHSSNRITGTVYEARTGVADYLRLKNVNRRVAEENARLREMLAGRVAPAGFGAPDSASFAGFDHTHRFLSAKVINNSTRNFNNYLTINRGSIHGVEKGMGVISDKGVIGMVMSVSDRFAMAVSLLSTEVLLSVKLKSSNTLGTVNWHGRSAGEIPLLYIPRHVGVQPGDTVVTSGYNAIFPEGIVIGTVREVNLESNATFYDIIVDIREDFYRLSYVYVVKNPLKEEKEQLEATTDE